MKTSRKNLFKKQVLPIGLLASAIILFAGCGKTDNTDSTSGSGSVSIGPSGTVYSGPFTCVNGRQDTTPNGLTRCTTDISPNNSIIQSLGNNGLYPSASSFPGVYAAKNSITATGTGSPSTNQPLTLPITVSSGDWISFQAVPSSYFQQLNSQGDLCAYDTHTVYDLSGSGLASYGYQTVIAHPDTNPNGLTSILPQPAAGCIFSLSSCISNAATVQTQCLALAASSTDVTACQTAYTSAVAACNATSTSSSNLTQTLSCLTPAPEGFLASIGGQIYALGNSFNSSVNITAGTGASMGTLYAGLNKTPWSNFCANIQIVYFKHQHCVDSSGNAAVCPDPRTSGDTSLLYP